MVKELYTLLIQQLEKTAMKINLSLVMMSSQSGYQR